MELFYAEKHHVLVSRVRISVNQAAPIELLTFFWWIFYVKCYIRVWHIQNLVFYRYVGEELNGWFFNWQLITIRLKFEVCVSGNHPDSTIFTLIFESGALFDWSSVKLCHGNSHVLSVSMVYYDEWAVFWSMWHWSKFHCGRSPVIWYDKRA